MSKCLPPDRLRAFLSDSLGPEDLTETLAHLRTCPNCQDAVNREADDSGFRREYLDSYVRARADDRTMGVDLQETLPHIPSQDSTVEQTVTDSLTVADSVGRYTLSRRLAISRSSEVWEAYDPRLKRRVAIKMLRRDRRPPALFSQGFLEEGQKLASLRHAGIVDVYDVGEHGSKSYIVTELLSGGTLRTLCSQPRPSFPAIAGLVSRVARAAQAAHAIGLIHRDIKPENVVLDADGSPRLSDFGLAIATLEGEQSPSDGAGTILYMSPEQSREQTRLRSNPQSSEQSRLGPATDIYSLGVVLYELLSGVVPHRGESIEATLLKIQLDSPSPLRRLNARVPASLEKICLKCLQKLPSDRFLTAADLADSLDAWCARREALPRLFAWCALSLMAGLTVIGISIGFSVNPSETTDDSRRNSTDVQRYAAALAPAIVPTIRVVTNPPNARVVVYPIQDHDGLPDGRRRIEAMSRTPTDLQLEPGFYLVVAALDDGRFHEVFRTVPAAAAGRPRSYRHLKTLSRFGRTEWPEIEIPELSSQTSFGLFNGSPRFAIGVQNNIELPQHYRRIPPFLLDPHEGTIGDYRAAFLGHLPASMAHLKGNAPPDNFPLSGLWWDDAVLFAEGVGKRLPTEAEYEFAATLGGTRNYPWGDEPSRLPEWPMGVVGQPPFDLLNTSTPVFGLYSNVPEWTSSPATPYPAPPGSSVHGPETNPGFFVVRGAPPHVVRGKLMVDDFNSGPRTRVAHYERSSDQIIGVRCARSVGPRLHASDLEVILPQEPVPIPVHKEGE